VQNARIADVILLNIYVVTIQIFVAGMPAIEAVFLIGRLLLSWLRSRERARHQYDTRPFALRYLTFKLIFKILTFEWLTFN